MILREACLRQALTMPAGYIWTREEVEQISNLFSWLEFLFAACGDIWNQRRVQTHRISIYARIFDKLALGLEIGRWGRETGNDEYMLRFGLLAPRLARHVRNIRGQIHAARHHVNIALAIFNQEHGSRRRCFRAWLLRSIVERVMAIINLRCSSWMI